MMAEVAGTCATLRIIGDDLEPDQITKLLGRPPSFSVRKGGLHNYPLNRPPRIARTGVWRIKEDRLPGDYLDRQIAAILLSLTSNLEVWKNIVRQFKVDMFCGIWLSSYGQGGTGLSGPTMQLLGERGILLDLDIYAMSPDDEDEAI